MPPLLKNMFKFLILILPLHQACLSMEVENIEMENKPKEIQFQPYQLNPQDLVPKSNLDVLPGSNIFLEEYPIVAIVPVSESVSKKLLNKINDLGPSSIDYMTKRPFQLFEFVGIVGDLLSSIGFITTAALLNSPPSAVLSQRVLLLLTISGAGMAAAESCNYVNEIRKYAVAKIDHEDSEWLIGKKINLLLDIIPATCLTAAGVCLSVQSIDPIRASAWIMGAMGVFGLSKTIAFHKIYGKTILNGFLVQDHFTGFFTTAQYLRDASLLGGGIVFAVGLTINDPTTTTVGVSLLIFKVAKTFLSAAAGSFFSR